MMEYFGSFIITSPVTVQMDFLVVDPHASSRRVVTIKQQGVVLLHRS